MSLDVFVISKEVDLKIIEELSNNFDSITVVTPDCSGFDNTKNIEFVCDSTYLNYSWFKDKVKDGLRVGWYYQQFLKYSIVEKSSGDNVLIIDGDSIVSDVVTKPVIFTTGKQAQEQYLKFNRRLLGGSIYEEESFVTNQMLFNKKIFHCLIDSIESHNATSWMNAILNIINNSQGAQFSEYQLYGSYAKNEHSVKVDKIKVFRRMDCINKGVEEGLEKYDLIAYESHHKTGLLRKIRAKILFKLGVSIG